MDNRKKFTVDTIKGKKFQINKVDARTSCWLYSFLASRTPGSLSMALGQCSRKEFDEIQGIALSSVFYLDSDTAGTFPTAIIAPNGAWSNEEIGSDPELIMALTIASLSFNIQPFLAESGSSSQKLVQSSQDGSQQNT